MIIMWIKKQNSLTKKDALCSLYHEVSGCVQSGIAAC